MPIIVKIGRAPSCDVKTSNPTVSSLHAEITVNDDGSLTIEDKNSTNGTFISNQRIKPDVPTPVTRGDHVRLGTEVLNWNSIPYPAKEGSKFKKTYSIGSNFNNDVTVNDQFVSRFHAKLRIAKNGKAYIHDLGSQNGTIVNGMRITPHQDVQVKRKDSILLGNKDITEELKPLIPDPIRPWRLAAIWLGTACAVAVILAVFLPKILGGGSHALAPDVARQAVVYVTARYQLTAKIVDNPISDDIWTSMVAKAFPQDPKPRPGELPIGNPREYFATAFFVDRNGVMATNRHVAAPWDLSYLPSSEQKEVKTVVDDFIDRQQLPMLITSQEILSYYNALAATDPSSILFRMIYNQTVREYNKGNIKANAVVDYMNSLIHQFKKSKVEVTGKMVSIAVGYPGRYYTDQNEYSPCVVIAQSDTPDIDLALIQLNTKHTPETVPFVFSPETYFTGKLEPLKEKLVWIGYPYGNFWNLDEKTFSLEPQIRETMAAKMPSKYNFEFQGEAVGGASGSPIYDPKSGQLVGVLWGGYVGGATFGHACQAKWLKKMYEEEVN